ncbi:MAG: Rieske 2Fe-2S domain-containing protein [Solirubrobacteraceae bacterium]
MADQSRGDEAPAASTDSEAIRPDRIAKVGDSRAATALSALLNRVVGDPYRGAYRAARKAHLTDLLHGSALLGHPLHPALSDLPIGLYIGAVIAYASGSSTTGVLLTMAGVAGALAAASAGLADWAVSDGRDKRLGAVHGVMNVFATLVAGGSIATYYAVSASWGLGLVAGALGVTFAAAYLGGHLVFDRGLMVRQANLSGIQTVDWTAVLPETELAQGEAKAVPVSDQRTVIVYRPRTGRITCIEGRCCHAGGPLGEGEMHDGTVVCPWHLSVFDLETGAVRRGPASRPQPVLQTRVVDGQIQVRDPDE